MSGPIQKSMSDVVSIASGITAGAKKIHESQRQAQEKLSIQTKAEEENQKAIEAEASNVALATDLIQMGADPESAEAFVNARELGLDTKSFGMIRKQGKFVGSYSGLADKLSKDSLTDSLSSKVMNEKGFANRIVALGGTRKGRITALVKASKGGNK